MRFLLQLISAGNLIVMGICPFSAAFAIGSFREAMVTYQEARIWLILSVIAFLWSALIAVGTGLTAEQMEKKEKPHPVREHRNATN